MDEENKEEDRRLSMERRIAEKIHKIASKKIAALQVSETSFCKPSNSIILNLCFMFVLQSKAICGGDPAYAEYANEALGDDFDNSPWVPPDITSKVNQILNIH